MWRGEARAGERGAATRGGERGEGGARGSSICVLPAMPRTSEALPPVYRRAELELNFPSSAEAGGDGTTRARIRDGGPARTRPARIASRPRNAMYVCCTPRVRNTCTGGPIYPP